MTPAHLEPLATIYHGDCVEVMAAMPEASVDAIVTDPPYGLEFMGKEWDRLVDVKRANRGTQPDRKRPPGEAGTSAKFQLPAPAFDLSAESHRSMQRWHEAWAREAYRVLKPGGHLLAFGGTRTYHRLACALEDAGFELRDSLMWLYGSGFPKSLDVSKAIDKAAGAERKVVGVKPGHEGFVGRTDHPLNGGWDRPWASDPEAVARYHAATAPATPEAALWAGWGTALKPAHEPIILARKSLAEKNVAANVVKHGTGALNVDGCRIKGAPSIGGAGRRTALGRMNDDGWEPTEQAIDRSMSAGRWPANVLLDEEAARLLDEQSGEMTSGVGAVKRATGMGYKGNALGTESRPEGTPMLTYGDTGGASRFFYTAKADKDDRDGSKHPTVKPVDLMKWLVTLVTPPAGVVLDPFLGSGTTVYAARALGLRSIGIEKDPQSVEDAIRRLRQGQLL